MHNPYFQQPYQFGSGQNVMPFIGQPYQFGSG